MNIEVSAYGLGGGRSGSSGGGSYDDTAIKQELARIKQAVAALPSGASYDDAEIKKELEAVKKQLSDLPKGGGATYDDSDLRKQLAAAVARIDEIADTRKEYQAAYIARADFLTNPANNEFMTVKFKKPFSKKPFVKVTLDLVTVQARLTYQANATETGFDIATNYAGSLLGLWYEAHLVD